MKKEHNFLADQVKSYGLTNEQEIVAGNGMCHTCPIHLE